ncbi:MAG: tetratricopeptide repeat protein, partial [Cyanobacteria bacterium J06648_11]
MIQWYISRNDIEQAEMFFRSEVTTAKNRDDALVTVVDFIQQTRGREAAMDELRQLIETEENTDLFRSLLAGFKFEGGAVLEAIGDLEAVVKDAELSTQTNNIKITLSRMLLLVGEGDRALTLASEVLTQDPTNVGALKIRASHEIEADQAGNAILTLRAAQDVAPRDPEILTIMARAYLRNGNRSLAGEMLSLAFEISEEAPTEGLRYAEFLQSDGALSSSLTVLQGALNRSPASVPLLAEMGAVQVGLEDFNRAERTESQLRALGTEEGSRAADRLRLERLRKQERVEEAIALIRELSGDDLNAAAMAEIIGIHMSTGEPEKAETYLEGVLDEDPENRAARFYLATLFALSDRLGLAETYLRGLIADSPDDEIV